MRDAGAVCRNQSRRNLRRDVERLIQSQPAARHSLAQRFAIDVLHRDEMHALHLFNLVNVGDVWMRE